MATTQSEIREWFERGKRGGATHMIVACDTFDHDDYPVYVKPSESVREKAAEYNGKNMQRVMEVYALHLPMEAQLAEHRAFHYESAPAVQSEMIADSNALHCFSNGTDTVSARDAADAVEVLRGIYGDDSDALSGLVEVPAGKVIAVWEESPEIDAMKCECLGWAGEILRRGNGHHVNCEIGHPSKTAAEWAKQGRGLVGSTEW